MPEPELGAGVGAAVGVVMAAVVVGAGAGSWGPEPRPRVGEQNREYQLMTATKFSSPKLSCVQKALFLLGYLAPDFWDQQ